VVPADHKWFSRVVVASAIISTLESLDLQFPTVTEAQKARVQAARKLLEAEAKGKG
jgi:hypothetical protein